VGCVHGGCGASRPRGGPSCCFLRVSACRSSLAVFSWVSDTLSVGDGNRRCHWCQTPAVALPSRRCLLVSAAGPSCRFLLGVRHPVGRGRERALSLVSDTSGRASLSRLPPGVSAWSLLPFSLGVRHPVGRGRERPLSLVSDTSLPTPSCRCSRHLAARTSCRFLRVSACWPLLPFPSVSARRPLLPSPSGVRHPVGWARERPSSLVSDTSGRTHLSPLPPGSRLLAPLAVPFGCPTLPVGDGKSRCSWVLGRRRDRPRG